VVPEEPAEPEIEYKSLAEYKAEVGITETKAEKEARIANDGAKDPVWDRMIPVQKEDSTFFQGKVSWGSVLMMML
jgi:hypothetical protein